MAFHQSYSFLEHDTKHERLWKPFIHHKSTCPFFFVYGENVTNKNAIYSKTCQYRMLIVVRYALLKKFQQLCSAEVNG